MLPRWRIHLILSIFAAATAWPGASLATVPLDDEAPAQAQQAANADTGEKDDLYLRITEDRGRTIALELAVREFVHAEGEGPKVVLVSIAHIGDRQLYRDMQAILAKYDIVLYEAVTPPGVGRPRGERPEEKVSSTTAALGLIASIAEAHRAETGHYPKDVDELREAARNIDGMVVNWLEAAMTDAWGNPIMYEGLPENDGYRIVSLGADGKPGGEGFDAEIEVDHTHNANPLVLARDNIQSQLADALGLSYQLAEMDYGAPNWRSSDMDMKALNEAFRERDIDFRLISDAIGGGATFPAQLARGLLGIIGALDRMMEGVVSDLAKIMMIEILGDQEMVKTTMNQLGPGFSEVLIDVRNQVVIDDLAAIIRDEPEVQSVAIFYGAAHMPDFARRLADQLDYEPADVHWISAISVDVTASRLDPRQVAQMRLMMRRMLQQQMRQLEQMQRRPR